MFPRFQTLFCVFAFLAALPAAHGHPPATASTPHHTEREILAEVKKFGELVPESRMPHSYEMVHSILSRLGPEYNRMFGINATNRVAIVDSPIVNAFVASPIRFNDGTTGNYVFVTKGLLVELASKVPPKDLPSVVAGSMAHEFGHPSIQFSPDQFKSHIKHWESNQAEELRADLFAIRLLEAAGIARDGMLRYLKATFEGQMRLGYHTHPEDTLRIVVQEIGITHARYSRGEVELNPLPAPQAEIMTELARPVEVDTRPRLVHAAEDIAGLVSQLRSYRGARSFRSQSDSINFTHLYLSLLEKIEGRGTKISDNERKEVLDFLLDFGRTFKTSKEGYPDFWRMGYEGLATSDGIVLGERGWPHPASVVPDKIESIAFFHDPRFKAWYREHFPSITEFNDSPHFSETKLLERAMLVAPMDLIIQSDKEAILKSYSKSYKDYDSGYFFLSARSESSSLREFKLQTLRLLEASKGANFSRTYLSANNFLRAKNEARIEGHSPLFFREEASGLSSEQQVRRRSAWFAFLDNPKNRDTKEALTQMAKAVWAEKGKFGILDLWQTNLRTRLDWETVFRLLHVNPTEGYRELNHSIREFSASRDYAALSAYFEPREHLPYRDGGAPEVSKPYERRAWLSDQTTDTLLEHSRSPEERELYYRANAKVAERDLLHTFKETLLKPGETVTEAKVARALRAVRQKLPWLETWPFPELIFPKIAEIVDHAPITQDEKTSALRYLFVDQIPKRVGEFGEDEITWIRTIGGSGFSGSSKALRYGWVYESTGNANEHTFRILKKNGVIQTPSKFLAEVYAPEKYAHNSPSKADDARRGPLSHTLEAIEPMEKLLLEEVEQIRHLPIHERAKALQDFAERVFIPYPADKSTTIMEWVGEPLLERVLRVGGEISSKAEQIKLVSTLLKAKMPRDIDAYIQDHLMEHFRNAALNSDEQAVLEELLSKGLILGVDNQVALTEKLIRTQVETARASGVTQKTLQPILDKVDKIQTLPSTAKEKVLENLGWNLKIRDLNLVKMIELRKSAIWGNMDPRVVHLITNLSIYFKTMDQREILDLMDFVASKGKRPFPDSVRSVMLKEVSLLPIGKQQQLAMVAKAQWQISRFTRETTDLEKVPFFHWAMKMGEHPLEKEADLVEIIGRRYLGYTPEGGPERFLKAFLYASPEQEHLASLAYLMGTGKHGGDQAEAYMYVAKAFGTPGIKAGQAISTWNLLNDEKIARRLEALKDEAGPMTLAEILEAVHREYPEIGERIISADRILGSASLKTVAEATLKMPDGTTKTVVLMVQRPYSRQKIAANLERMKKLLVGLNRFGFNIHSGGLGKMLDSIERQLTSETRMKVEAENFEAARKFYEGLNGEKLLPEGWRFSVPKLVEGFEAKDTVLVMEKVTGETFKKLPHGEIRDAVGKAIVESSIRGLFREGWFDPDRHTGNILVDAVNKVVHMIDFGQATRFHLTTAPHESDDRYLLAQLLRAIDSRDAEATLLYLERMAREHDPAQFHLLRNKIHALYEGRAPASKSITSLVSTMSEHGMVMKDEFLSSALKGLMTLASENYVDHETFKSILSREAATVLMGKAPIVIEDIGKTDCLRKTYQLLEAGT